MFKYCSFSLSLVIGILLFAVVPILAQTVDTAWVRRYNGPGNLDYASALAVDGLGKVFVTGMSSDVFPGTRHDYATIKYDRNGNQLWVSRWDGQWHQDDSASAIAVDGSGNVYVTGWTKHSYAYPYNEDYATIKYGPNGNLLWAKTYNGPGDGTDLAHSIAVDGSGNVYVTGGSWGGWSTGYDCTTIKYDPSGNQLWVRRYDASDWARAIAVDNSGNVFVTGGGLDLVTIKYDPNGNLLWTNTYTLAISASDWGEDIALDGSGNVYVTGMSSSNLSDDYITIKYFPNGDTAWARRYQGPVIDHAYAIALDGSGNVIVTGKSESGGKPDYLTIKYGPNGNQFWVQRYSGPGIYGSYAYDIAVDGYGNAYVTGWTYNNYTTIKYYPNGYQAWLRTYNGQGSLYLGACAIIVDGSYNVYVTGERIGSGTSSDYTTIKYWQNYTPIITSPDGSKFFCEPDTLEFPVTATDSIPTDTLTLSGPGIPTPIKGVSPLTVNVKIYVSSAGTYNYIYTVTDSRGVTDKDTSRWVITMNSPPTVTAPDSSKFLGGPDTIRFQVTATDPNVSDTLTLSGPGIPAPLKGKSPLSANIKIYINSAGIYNFIYVVSDSCGVVDEDTATWIISRRGDVNNDGVIDIGDIVYLINYVFYNGDPPIPFEEVGDCDCDGIVDISDIVFLINYVFYGGEEPNCL